jgi:hypothetical protein
MTVDEILTALDLPASARVDQRVPKKLLLEHGAPTAADKRHINEGIEELHWLAALKPTTIGVPEYRDDAREYLEIAVLRLTLREGAKATRLVELVHRAIPYPVLLLTEQAEALTLSLANKRLSQNETGKFVLDDKTPCSVGFSPRRSADSSKSWTSPHATSSNADHGKVASDDSVVDCVLVQHAETVAFLKNLTLAAQPRSHLFAVYQGWVVCLETLHAAQLTGRFVPPSNAAVASARRDSLAEHARLQREIALLRVQAQRESQVNRRVELNLEIKRLEARTVDAIANLSRDS